MKTEDLIRERFRDQAVCPQILSPDQSVGDAAQLPIFPNLGLGVKALKEDLRRLTEEVSRQGRLQETLVAEQSVLKSSLDAAESSISNLSGSTPIISGNSESAEKDTLSDRYYWLESVGLRSFEWKDMPVRVKKEVLAYLKRLKTGRYWLMFAAFFCFLCWLLALYGLFVPPNLDQSYYLHTRFMIFRDVLISTCGLMLVIHFTYFSVGNRAQDFPAADPESLTLVWDNYDVVIKAREQTWRRVLGLEIGQARRMRFSSTAFKSFA